MTGWRAPSVLCNNPNFSKEPNFMVRYLFIIALACSGAAGQSVQNVRISPPEAGAAVGMNTFRYVSSDVMVGDALVKGAPYSAEAVTETTQMLPDGNRIHRQNSSRIFRDSQGRTRRELSLGTLGPWVAAQPKTITWIKDPVAGFSYVLNSDEKTATKATVFPPDTLRMRTESDMPALPPLPPPVSAHAGAMGVAMVYAEKRTEGGPPSEDTKSEALGSQVIEGVRVDGTRTTTTIPAGRIGNDRPIEIVTESWYSPELQTVVQSKRSDPMSGDTTFKLTNISRDEPDHSLFEVPPGYTVRDAPKPEIRVVHKEKEED
jgi:hypothetical protein